MPIHRMQGYEFDNVLVILLSVESAILNYELWYVTVSPAKSSKTLFGNPNSLVNSIKNTQNIGYCFSKILGNHACLNVEMYKKREIRIKK